MQNYTDLNSKEIQVLKAISMASKSQGGDFTDFNDVMEQFDDVLPTPFFEVLNAQQVKGYISQLSQKGYISVEEGAKNPQIFSGKYVDFLTHYKF